MTKENKNEITIDPIKYIGSFKKIFIFLKKRNIMETTSIPIVNGKMITIN